MPPLRTGRTMKVPVQLPVEGDGHENRLTCFQRKELSRTRAAMLFRRQPAHRRGYHDDGLEGPGVGDLPCRARAVGADVADREVSTIVSAITDAGADDVGVQKLTPVKRRSNTRVAVEFASRAAAIANSTTGTAAHKPIVRAILLPIRVFKAGGSIGAVTCPVEFSRGL